MAAAVDWSVQSALMVGRTPSGSGGLSRVSAQRRRCVA
jgi:hypothetical protein